MKSLNNHPIQGCLYEDRDLIVCHKKAGIAVQSANARQKDMVSELRNYLIPKEEDIYVVHRLDQPVEGIIVFAKNKKTAASLSSQITRGTMGKIYKAVCCYREDMSLEVLQEKCKGTVHLEDYLIKDGRTNTSRVVQKGQKDAKLSILDFTLETIIPEKKCLIAKIDLKTGRHHQIRVQMANAELPLYGDGKYNRMTNNYHESTSRLSGQQLALCAVQLSFDHPKTGKRMEYIIEPENKIFNEILL